MFNYPVIVIGQPRSGTTMTARVLQDIGVKMDCRPMRPDNVINPYGWFEDYELVEANTLLLNGTIPIKAWTRRFKRFIRKRSKNITWGFKDPRLIPIFNYALSFFNSPTIIRCHRPKERVIKSQIKKLGWKRDYAEERWDDEENILNKTLKNKQHFRFNFDEYISEEKIKDFFQDFEVIRNVA